MYIIFIFWLIYIIYSSIAQSVEHATVNRRVVGSSPTWGAREKSECSSIRIFYVFGLGKSPLCTFSVCIRMLIRHWLFVFSSVAHRLEAPVLYCKKCLHREGEYDKIDALANEEYDVFMGCVRANTGH